MIIISNLFKVRARTAKVIIVCCFRDPRGLLKREPWHVSPPNIESSTYVRTWSCQHVELLPNDLRGCPQENHAKPCRRCYRLDHRTGLFSVCKYIWMHYFQIWYDWVQVPFLCVYERETIFTMAVIEGRNFLKFFHVSDKWVAGGRTEWFNFDYTYKPERLRLFTSRDRVLTEGQLNAFPEARKILHF